MMPYSLDMLRLRAFCHLSVGVFAVIAASRPLAQTSDNSGTAAFTVFAQGARIGTQRVEVKRTDAGWRISSVGRINAPLDLVTTKFELTYASDWHPQRLDVECVRGGTPIVFTTVFGKATATSEVVQNGQRASTTQPMSPQSVVLPTDFFAAYEGLASRLGSATPGTILPVYVAPEFEARITVDRITPRRVVTPDRTLALREFSLTMTTPKGTVGVEVWTDERQRLARVALPATSVAAVRDDLTSVMARVESEPNPGEESVFIPANGFTLAGTIANPGAGKRVPAVVLVSSAGPHGRDYLTYGVPVFEQLSKAIAAAGYFVVRYDSRGVGQSGGRTETAGLTEYADDVRNVVAWLKKREKVDADRVALIAYGESGPIAMI